MFPAVRRQFRLSPHAHRRSRARHDSGLGLIALECRTLVDVELDHDDFELAGYDHAAAFEHALCFVDSDDVEPLVPGCARGRGVFATSVEIHTDPIATANGIGKMHRLDAWCRIETATIVDEPSAGARWRIREIHRLLYGIGHEEIEIGYVVEGEADRQANGKPVRYRLCERLPQSS